MLRNEVPMTGVIGGVMGSNTVPRRPLLLLLLKKRSAVQG